MPPARRAVLTTTQPGPIRVYSTAELLKLPDPTWLIDRVLPASGLIGLYGKPGMGKSFVALDMALAVASGRAWQGHEVMRGPVLYIAAEGGPGLPKRVRAWLSHHQCANTIPAFWILEPLLIHDGSDDIDALAARLEHELGTIPVLMVVDTLAWCFDGEENETGDMKRFVGGLGLLRQQYGCALLVIHHSRLDGERERGNTAFRGGIDTLLQISCADNEDPSTGAPMTVTCVKQKDAEPFAPFDLRLVPQGESMVVTGPVEEQRVRTQFILDLLGNRALRTRDMVSAGMVTGLSKRTILRGLRDTIESGKIIKENGYYRVIGATDDLTSGTD